MQTLKIFRNHQLTHTNKFYSGALWGPVHERPIADRVMSTPTWPVPYYQRHYKSYPIRENKLNKSFLSLAGNIIDDSNWFYAKKCLNKTLKGRQSVQYVENNLNLQNYQVVQKDVARMAKAYVSDISLFLNCANKENKLILDKCDLI